MIKFLRYVLASFFIFFLVAAIILQTEEVNSYAKENLTNLIEKETGYKAEIEELSIYPSFQFTAEGVSIYDRENKLIGVQMIKGSMNPFSLVNRSIDFYQLEFQEIKFYGDKDCEEKLAILLARGNLLFNPTETEIKSDLTFILSDHPNISIVTKASYEGGKGNVQLNTTHGIHIASEFAISHDKIFRINHFHASFESYSLDGTASLTHEGIFNDSSIIFTTGELSESLPFKGYSYGEGKILGSLLAPELDLKIFSDELTIKDTSLTNLQARVLSRHSKRGLGGEISISFVKDMIPYEFSGRIFWNEALGPFPSRFTAKTNLAEVAEIFNIDTSDVSGDIDIALTFTDKDIKGTATLKNGQLESYQLGSLITEIEAELEGDLHQVHLKRFEARDGDNGRYYANGSMELDISKRFPFSYTLAIEKAHFLQLDEINAIATGELTLQGNIDKAELNGTITTNSASYNIPEKNAFVAESIEIIYVNQSLNEAPPTASKVHHPEIPLNLNVKVNIPEKAIINDSELSSTWKGEFTITGTPLFPKYNGELNVVTGKYRLRGRQLDINKGSITFAGELDKKTSLYVIGEMDIDRYTIEIIVKGLISNPAISFRSNPPLSRKEILSWLLFNKDISDISEFQGNRLDQSMMTLSTETDDGPDILTRIGDAVGLDRIDITGSPNAGQVSFELGKYVSDNTYISISRKPNAESTRIGSGTQEQDQQDQSNRIGIETNLGKNFKLQAEVDEDQAGQINLIWKRDY